MAVRDLSLDHPLPDNLDAERFVLGAIMSSDNAFLQVAGTLGPEDFSLEKHKRIFLRMMDLHERGEKIDRVTLANELMKQGQLQSVDGLSYLVSLDDGLPQLYNIDSYVSIVKEKALLRRIITVSQDTINRCYGGDEDPKQILGAVEDAFIALGDVQSRNSLANPAQIITEYEGGINAFLDTSKRIKGISTGFLKFDEMTGGLREGELFILAARPAMGKTALALNIAQHVASNPKNPKAVAVFSLEMSKESLLTRMLCAAARVDQQRFRAGYLNADERRSLQDAMYRMVESPLFLDDTAGTNLMDVHSKLRRLQAEQDLGLVIIDYLQLMQGRGRFENRVQEISSLSRGFKLMSKELRVPFLVLSQLSRAPETRTGDHRPMLSDLRESGCLPGNTLIPIPCSGKRMPIRELLGKKNIHVWALNEKTLKLEAAPISNAFSTGVKPVFKLTTQLGKTIRATANHPFRVLSRWKPLNELSQGEYIALPRLIAGGASATMGSAELALLGHLIGDGCTLPRHVIQYTTRERELAELVASFAVQCFGAEVAPRISTERKWFQVYLTSTRAHTHGVHSAITDWLENLGVFGLRSWEKKIPERIFQQPAESIGLFLRHLWATDGCIALRTGREKRIPLLYYATSSEKLARDLQSLLLRLEINGRIRRVSQGEKGRDQFHVIITGAQDLRNAALRMGAVGATRNRKLEELLHWMEGRVVNTNRDVIPEGVWRSTVLPAMRERRVSGRELASRLDMSYCGTQLYRQNISRGRAERLGRALENEYLAALATSDLYWDRVVSVMPDGEEEVFDVTVPNYSNFVATDFVVHNSIEQDADLVAFIFREEVYRPDKESLKGVAELILSKQRNGPTGRVKLAFLNRYTKFENLAADTGEEDTPFE